VGDKVDNLFIADFEGKVEKDRALEGSPWMIGKFAVILQDYNEKLRPSDVCFDRMSIWVRILDLPFGWMNAKKGEKVARSIGRVEKIDVNEKGKASGSFLRARVALEINKPLRRGLFLRDEEKKANVWYAIQYEKLPFSVNLVVFWGTRSYFAPILACVIQTGSFPMISSCERQKTLGRRRWRVSGRRLLVCSILVLNLRERVREHHPRGNKRIWPLKIQQIMLSQVKKYPFR